MTDGGLNHILKRHSADLYLKHSKGDLFPKGTTNEHIELGVRELYSRGVRKSDPNASAQVFEKRIKLNGEIANYRLIVNKSTGEVTSFFKIGQ